MKYFILLTQEILVRDSDGADRYYKYRIDETDTSFVTLLLFLCGTDKLMSVLHSRRCTCFEPRYALPVQDWEFTY
jgi:hypothetical protein